MTALNWQRILAAEPELIHLAEDEQTHINHPDCPAGRDTKKRLYVRKADGGLLGYCHHCDSKGYRKGKRNFIKRAVTGTSGTVNSIQLPSDFTKDWSEFPTSGRGWFTSYCITPQECLDSGIGYSPQMQRLILPVYDGNMKLKAYQARRLFDYDKGPKYTTTKNRDTRFPMFLGTSGTTSGPVVITEDILSAIKVSRHMPAVSILGVHLSDGNAEYLGTRYDQFVIFLDDDNAEVRRQQRKIAKRLGLYGTCTTITGHTVDPKAMTDGQIRDVLHRHRLTPSRTVGQP